MHSAPSFKKPRIERNSWRRACRTSSSRPPLKRSARWRSSTPCSRGREVGNTPAILAPDRTLLAAGAQDDDYTYVHPFVGKIVVSGITLMTDSYFFCTP